MRLCVMAAQHMDTKGYKAAAAQVNTRPRRSLIAQESVPAIHCAFPRIAL
jgi:hypothetical protein